MNMWFRQKRVWPLLLAAVLFLSIGGPNFVWAKPGMGPGGDQGRNYNWQ